MARIQYLTILGLVFSATINAFSPADCAAQCQSVTDIMEKWLSCGRRCRECNVAGMQGYLGTVSSPSLPSVQNHR
ncbi:hypothetical protein CF319_g1401 [Tilletia indica]|nr:hypothetical protein CF319_g1401 [Tilletia indica]